MSNIYLKIPSRTYKKSELNKLDKEEEREDESEVDKLIRKSLNKTIDPKEVKSVITWTRIPLDDFIGCSYDSSTSIENSEDEFADGFLGSSIIFMKDGQVFPCEWSVEKLEDFLIDYGIVNPLIKKQEEKL